MKGRKRKPNAQAKAEGTLRSNKHREEVATDEPLQMPDWLVDPAALECWHRLVRQLGDIGYLVGTDADIVARYSQASADYQEAIETMRKEGKTIMTGSNGTLRNHPAWTRQKEAAAEMQRCGQELGLSPSSRASLGDKGVGEKQKDEFGEWEAKVVS